MLDDELVQGRFYFANGDFYMGTFKNNEMVKGTYIRFEDKLKVTEAEAGEDPPTMKGKHPPFPCFEDSLQRPFTIFAPRSP